MDDTLAPACGSPDPSVPTRGCVGYDLYKCMDSGPLTATDRELPLTLNFNGCAPGFIPFFYEATGTTVVRCTGFCAVLEIDNTPAHSMNHKGDPTALGKLPTQPQPRIGDAMCDVGKKGSHASSTCKFIWPYVADRLTGLLPAWFAASRHLDTLGVCQATDFFRYDPTGQNNATTSIPDCATLPPYNPSAPTVENASNWSCQKRSNSPVASGRAPDLRLGYGGPAQLRRHTFD